MDSDCLSSRCTAGRCYSQLTGTGGSSGGGTGGGATGGGATGGGVTGGGTGGGNDEFVELHNPGNLPVTFDSTSTIAFRSATGTCSMNTEADRYSGAGQIVPAHGYLLLTNTGYGGAVAGDGTYSLGLVDSGSLVLRRSGVTVDALCSSSTLRRSLR